MIIPCKLGDLFKLEGIDYLLTKDGKIEIEDENEILEIDMQFFQDLIQGKIAGDNVLAKIFETLGYHKIWDDLGKFFHKSTNKFESAPQINYQTKGEEDLKPHKASKSEPRDFQTKDIQTDL